jgi:hypothetical protein
MRSIRSDMDSVTMYLAPSTMIRVVSGLAVMRSMRSGFVAKWLSLSRVTTIMSASLLVVKPAILVRYPPLSAGMGIRLADTHPDGDAKGLAATAEMAGGLSRTPPSWGLAAGRNLTSQSTTKEPVLLSFWS